MAEGPGRGEPNRHILLVSSEAWGHTRPLCALAAKIVQNRPTYITLVATLGSVERIKIELQRHFKQENDVLQKWIRIISIESLDGFRDLTFEAKMRVWNKSFAELYRKLVDEVPVAPAHEPEICVQSIQAPDLAIIDIIHDGVFDAIRKISKNPIRILGWVSNSASSLFIPERYGGRKDRQPQLDEALRQGKIFEDVVDDIILGCDGTLQRAPGLPPMYDYEHHPQEIRFPKGMIGAIWLTVTKVLDMADGLVLTTAEAYEYEAIAAIRKWLSENNRDAYAVGPLIAPTISNNQENHRLEEAKLAQQHLNIMLRSHGPNALLYISFGSFFWPTRTDILEAFLCVVMEKHIPFILSHGSPIAKIPQELASRIKAYEPGLLVNWAPQQTILGHPVTGWFVTHCGQNSALESICAGVPMICWPQHADQPANAARLSHTLGVAYELFEVRTGEDGMKPLFRGVSPVGTSEAVKNETSSVLERAFGPDGDAKRARMRKLGENVLKGWDEGGQSKQELERLLNLI